MAKTILVTETGGPEVMKFVERDPGNPGPVEVRLRQNAIGVNFVDVHHRRGSYPMDLPLVLGYEAAGVVEAVGGEVKDLHVGDRVAYAAAPLVPGAYAEARLLPANRAVKLPPDVTDADAAALLFRGITVQGLVRSAHPIKAGDVILLHAAAGGIGSLLARWAKHLGATVIGTVRSAAKAEKARANGCDHVIVSAEEDFVERVLALTDGKGVTVAYDGVGRDTLLGSLKCVRRFGLLVSFGQASGPIPPLDIGLLGAKSQYLQKYSVKVYMMDPAEYLARAAETLAAIESGILPRTNYIVRPFSEVHQVHRELESGNTTGIFVLKT